MFTVALSRTDNLGFNMEENEKTLPETISDFLNIARRHKYYLTIPFIIISAISSVVAMKMPLTFVSMGTILIEQQQVPQSMIQTTVTGFADERIRFIQQHVMTRESILSIIDKYHLYQKEREKSTPSDLVKKFQDDVDVDLISADVKSTQGGGKATIAFTISFKSQQPAIAQSVANELVNLFLAENTRVRTQRATKTTEFLSEEADRINREIQGMESKIAEFKEKNGKSLPELLPSNLAAVERTSNELRQTEGLANLLKDRIAYLTAELPRARQTNLIPQQAGEKPTPGLSKEEQLRTLKAEYMQLSSQYNPTHPDVLRVGRQIKALDPSFTGSLDQQDVALELEKTWQELDALKEKYGEDHPDVVKLKLKAKKLEGQTASKPADSRPAPDVGAGSDDPIYINLVGQLKSSQSELDNLVKRQAYLQKTLEQLNDIIAQTPQVERGYHELLRDRELSLEKFAKLKSKVQEAKLAQTLEEEQKGESFTLIEPPALPDKPEKGKRSKFLLVGVFGGLIAGGGMAALAELLDSSVRGKRALQAVTGIPPMIVIPYIKNDEDLALERRKRMLLWIWCLVFLVIAILLVHFVVMPLDEIWDRLAVYVQKF